MLLLRGRRHSDGRAIGYSRFSYRQSDSLHCIELLDCQMFGSSGVWGIPLTGSERRRSHLALSLDLAPTPSLVLFIFLYRVASYSLPFRFHLHVFLTCFAVSICFMDCLLACPPAALSGGLPLSCSLSLSLSLYRSLSVSPLSLCYPLPIVHGLAVRHARAAGKLMRHASPA